MKNIKKITSLQEQVITEFESLRDDGKITDSLIANAYIHQITSRYSLAGYQLKQDHPELFKDKKTKLDRREYMKKYMRKYLPKYRKKKNEENKTRL